MSITSITARVTSKGQVTIPVSVRRKLGIRPGDSVGFDTTGKVAVLAKVGDIGSTAGAVEVPVSLRGLSFEQIRKRAWVGRA